MRCRFSALLVPGIPSRLEISHCEMADDFKSKTVPWLKEYLTNRGIQVSDQGRNKRKSELVELAEKAFEMKIRRIDNEDEDVSEVIAD